MIEKVSFDNQTEDEALLNDVGENTEDNGLDVTMDEIIELAAELAISFKCKDPVYAENFKRRYITINKMVLTFIGFNKALRSVSIQSLPPEYALGGGIATLILTAIFIPTGEPKERVKAQPAPPGSSRPKPVKPEENKHDESNPVLEPVASQASEKKVNTVSKEDMEKFFSILNEKKDEGGEKDDVSNNG